MTGADAVLATAAEAGVTALFANPGTTELPLVQALERHPRIRPVLGLFEGVCSGACDGFGRVAGKPALALLHFGVGLAYALPNLHNAKRAGTPVVVLLGEHTAAHLKHDPIHKTDVAAMAQAMGLPVRFATTAAGVAKETALAIALAQQSAGPVVLVLPIDCLWGSCEEPVAPVPPPAPPRGPQAAQVAAAAQALAAGKATLLLGGRASRAAPLRTAERIGRACGCDLLLETFPAAWDVGDGLKAPRRIPYPPGPARALLAQYPFVVLAGAKDPISTFASREGISRLCADGAKVVDLCAEGADPGLALEALADAVGAPEAVVLPAPPRPERPGGKLTASALCRAIAATQPEGAIVMNEGGTAGRTYFDLAPQMKKAMVMMLTGGAIGQGLPACVGAAVAAPERRVIGLESDGSSLYTLQALWTMARERLNVTVVLCKNGVYQVLRNEVADGGERPTAITLAMTDLTGPDIDHVRLAQGFGLQARTVRSAEEAAQALEDSFGRSGPALIEAVLDGP